jgi:hypothetical protein
MHKWMLVDIVRSTAPSQNDLLFCSSGSFERQEASTVLERTISVYHVRIKG